MTKSKAILWKVDVAMAFLDLKVMLLVWILVSFYRSTVLLSGLNLSGFHSKSDVLRYAWESAGSNCALLAILAIVGDVIVKRMLKSMIEG